VPRPSHSFDQRFQNLCFYYELYDLPSDADTLSALYEITDDEGRTVRRISRSVERVFHAQSVNCGINIQSFQSGEYKLLVTVSDDKENVLAQKETAFTIAKAQRQAVSYEDMPYYREIEYFLSPRQYKEFLSLPEEGKKPFLDRFWRTFDYFAVAARFDYVNDHYKFGDTPGYKTDRGRIYVKYGEPDEIEKPLPLQHQEQRPYEHWQYPNGEQFIFVDVRGINDYILVWTNCLEERSQPTLYKYLPQELLDRVQ
jgi:GWxTD domain-containing protein